LARLGGPAGRGVTVEGPQKNGAAGKDGVLWTAGFFNERFTAPVSPLGWSVVGSLVEQIALREPLHYLGSREFDRSPILRLYQGHPYVRVAVLQTIYKPFPDALVPEDAARYFPGGDVALRRQAAYPCCILDPRMLVHVGWSFLRDAGNWWPWGNHRLWSDFARRHQAAVDEMAAEADRLAESPAGGRQRIWSLLDRCRQADVELLRLHRWSLTHADLAYTALRRMLAAWVDREGAPSLAAGLVHGVPNLSLTVDRALNELADLARGRPALMSALAAADPALVDAAPEGDAFRAALAGFLLQHGHRSFSLDIWHPPFRDDPAQVLALAHSLALQPRPAGDWAEHEQGATPASDALLRDLALPAMKRWSVRAAVLLARRYLPLRENQRYLWQRSLALRRRLYLLLGGIMVAEGRLGQTSDVFFLTEAEARPGVDGSLDLARQRRQDHDYLMTEWRETVRSGGQRSDHYPAFLRGDAPLDMDRINDGLAAGVTVTAPEGRSPDERRLFHGHPVSPGVARGPARLVTGPDELERVERGDVLVVTSTDPAWTPVFGLLAALVMERGGQLSHGAVVAREYGLPAVAGLAGIMAAIREGDWLEVDGCAGTVRPVASPRDQTNVDRGAR
jgi:phosphohistidine swiveling domain-containing protein